jgi:predicted thioredoxin/glutaredoxin
MSRRGQTGRSGCAIFASFVDQPPIRVIKKEYLNMLQSTHTQTRAFVAVEVFLERGCRSSAAVIEAVNGAADRIRLDVRVYFRDRDPLEFLRRGLLICPATFIDGSLAFYGPIGETEILEYIHRNIPSLLSKGDLQ